ncbi:hypothetical protein [Saccharothrix syringae]|uniref:Uncharacterized protein n=1 Tax=Saccharothrix syringae TaxID=103733 RepID=A0A5Q0H1L0_SACSY|nr:hypothetical protein [Saccharothrix syringae]QFZ19670.1 hypothetical protein EKG83_21545 [Saccharothrix syringae]
MSGTPEILNPRPDLAAGVPVDAAGYARDKVTAVAEYAPADGPRSIAAHAGLDVNGTPVNAQATAGTYREAVDLLHDRLRHRLANLGR